MMVIISSLVHAGSCCSSYSTVENWDLTGLMKIINSWVTFSVANQACMCIDLHGVTNVLKPTILKMQCDRTNDSKTLNNYSTSNKVYLPLTSFLSCLIALFVARDSFTSSWQTLWANWWKNCEEKCPACRLRASLGNVALLRGWFFFLTRRSSGSWWPWKQWCGYRTTPCLPRAAPYAWTTK